MGGRVGVKGTWPCFQKGITDQRREDTVHHGEKGGLGGVMKCDKKKKGDCGRNQPYINNVQQFRAHMYAESTALFTAAVVIKKRPSKSRTKLIAFQYYNHHGK